MLGHVDVTAVLLFCGAFLGIKNKQGLTPKQEVRRREEKEEGRGIRSLIFFRQKVTKFREFSTLWRPQTLPIVCLPSFPF